MRAAAAMILTTQIVTATIIAANPSAVVPLLLSDDCAHATTFHFGSDGRITATVQATELCMALLVEKGSAPVSLNASAQLGTC